MLAHEEAPKHEPHLRVLLIVWHHLAGAAGGSGSCWPRQTSQEGGRRELLAANAYSRAGGGAPAGRGHLGRALTASTICGNHLTSRVGGMETACLSSNASLMGGVC